MLELRVRMLGIREGGTYSYHCEIHPDTMRGTVIVQ